MSAGAAWFRDEALLLSAVRGAGATGVRPPTIPGYDDWREVGRGGQGVVYAATQRSTKRQVAIKLLLDGAYASESARRRFEREIDLVATLQHPNIVRLYDSGTTAEGYPFYVMEYVEGVSLDALLGVGGAADVDVDARGAAGTTPVAGAGAPLASLRATVTMFVKICQAVSYAHQRGVIHRDLKPGNIRVDPAGEPHVLDFGLAKSATPNRTQMSVEGSFTGSLPWASPEQVEGIPSRIDLRTDVYSLGVLLYQALTGAFPYPLNVPFNEAIQSIRQSPPARPSQRRPEVDDELETIVLKSLAKEPERRYQSAGELARDLQRYLAGEPIEAKRDSAWYQVKKTLHRYRLLAGVACTFLILAVGVAISTSVLYTRARHAEQIAEERRAQAENETDKARRTQRFLEGMFGTLDPTLAQDYDPALLRRIIADAARRVEEQLSAQPEVEAPVRATIGRTYANLGDYTAAETQLQAALTLYQRSLGPAHVETLKVLSDLSSVYQEQGRYDEAEPLIRQALDGFRRTFGERHRETLSAMNNLAYLLDNRGEPEQAERLHRETLTLRRQVLGEDDVDTLNSKSNLGQMLLDRGALDEATPLVQETLAMRRRVLGPDHPDTLNSLNNAARLANEQGNLTEAADLYRQAVDGYRRVLGPASPRTVQAMSNLAVVHRQRGELDEAETQLRTALDLQTRSGREQDPVTASIRNNLARTLQDAGKLAEAEPLLRSVLAQLERDYGPDHPQTLLAVNNMAGVLADLERREEAITLFRRCAEVRSRVLGPSHPETLVAGNNLAATLRADGQLAEALTLCETLVKSADSLPPEHPLRPALQGNYGETLMLLQRYAEAEPLLVDSYETLRTARGPAHPATRRAAARLVRLYETSGQPERAAKYAAPADE